MPLQPIPGFIGGSHPSRGKGSIAMRTVNFRLEHNPPGSKTEWSLYPRAGKKRFTTLLDPGPITGMWANKTRVFAVSQGNLYEIFEDGSNQLFGTVAVGDNPTTMVANKNQLLICSAGNVYVATGTQVFQPVISFARGTCNVVAQQVTWVDGDKFTNNGASDIVSGTLIQIAGVLYHVSSVQDDQNLTLLENAGSSTNVGFQAGDELLTGATCDFVDGYFIVNVPNTKTFRISQLEDGTIWDAIDVQTKNSSVDNIARVKRLNGQLALIGDTDSTEIWGDSGNADFPFQKLPGSINYGTAAAWSVATLPDGSVCMLMSTTGGENQVIRISPYGLAQVVSHKALENAIQSYDKVFDAVGYTYVGHGHAVYRLEFPTPRKAWEYQPEYGTWCEVGIETDADVFASDFARFRVHVTWPSGKRMDLVSHPFTGNIYESSIKYEDDDGVDFAVLRIGPFLNTNETPVTVAKFVLVCDLGSINPTDLGLDGKPLIPTVELSYSDDGANTWSDAGPASVGRVGEYEGTYMTADEVIDATPNSQTNPQVFNPMPMWTGLGSFRISRAFRIKSSGRMLRAVHGALVDFGAQK